MAQRDARREVSNRFHLFLYFSGYYISFWYNGLVNVILRSEVGLFRESVLK